MTTAAQVAFTEALAHDLAGDEESYTSGAVLPVTGGKGF